jgi:hypothetical protein
MQILDVDLPGEKKAPLFSYDDKRLTVQLPRRIGTEDSIKLGVKYRLADPPKGMHFILPGPSEPNKPRMVYTMSEPLEARYWFPTHDWPNERWTSDILVTVPAPYTVVANGILRAKKAAPEAKSVTFHWYNEVPTDPHLMGFVFGELVETRDARRGKPVLAYTQSGRADAAREPARRLLTEWLYDPDRTAQAAAVTALGNLGDLRSIADLERVRTGARDEEVQHALRGATESIRRAEDPKRATSALIERLEAIEKQNQALEKKLKSLSEQLERLKEPAKKKTDASPDKK